MNGKIIYVFLIILLGLFLGRKYLKGFILHLRDKNKNRVEKIDTDLVYVPVLSSRVFTFSIEIKELGGGKASVIVVKQKDLQ